MLRKLGGINDSNQQRSMTNGVRFSHLNFIKCGACALVPTAIAHRCKLLEHRIKEGSFTLIYFDREDLL